MAMRSSGGTGVLIALIIFIFLTVGSATAAILLYGQKTSANEELSREKAVRTELMRASERESVAPLLQEASRKKQSLVGYLVGRSNSYREFVAGMADADEDSTRERFRITGQASVVEAFNRMLQENNLLTAQIAESNARVDAIESELSTKKDDFKSLQMASDDRVANVHASISEYADAAQSYRADIDKTRNEYRRSLDENTSRHRNEVADLQDEIDNLNGNQTVLSGRLNELRKVVEAIRVRPKNPAELVDGRVVDVLGSSGQVFIDLGRNDRIRPGMTFRVYDDANQIQMDPTTGEYARGKASLQVIKVAESTATARVTDGASSRPVVRGDVIANAVFNPEHRFKFLVFGQFDVDSNGSSSMNEANYIKSRIIEWGGEVVEGNQLTGDLDFLVLGEVPDFVSTELIPADASPAEIDAILKRQEAYDRYDELFQQAINAQIPVLNWNRFRLLTGDGDA